MWLWMSTSPLSQTPYGGSAISYRELARRGGEVRGKNNNHKQAPNDGSMGSTVYLLILMQHVVPALWARRGDSSHWEASDPPSGYSQRWLNAYNSNSNNLYMYMILLQNYSNNSNNQLPTPTRTTRSYISLAQIRVNLCWESL